MNTLNVLVIDDSKTARLFSKKCVQMSMKACTLNFFEAENGEEALNILHQTKMNLIISDVNMPIMSGFTFLRNVKMEDELKKIPVIFVTSLANEARTENLMGLGAVGVISKPIKPKELTDIVQKLNLCSCPGTDGWGA